ncbi:MAG: secretin N-terminal domain-containing protein [Candidatus Krumholzibacteriia bacterium]
MTLNVKNMQIQDVLKLVVEKGDLNLAIGTGVTGALTLFVVDLPVEEVVELVVDLAGVAYAVENGVHRVMTPADFEARYGRPYRDINRRQFIELEHAPVQDVLASLAPFRSGQGQLFPDARTNGLVVFETPFRLGQIQSVVEALDRPLPTRAFQVTGVSPQEMAGRLKSYLPPTAQIEPDAIGQRILVTGSESTMQSAARLISLLDRAERLQTRVFALTYVSPDTVVAAVAGLLTQEVGALFVDGRARQLLVTDFPGPLDEIGDRIALLDVAVRQVLIEARIIQVNLTDETKTGIDWQVLEERLNSLDVRAVFPVLSDTDDGLRIQTGDLEADDYKVVVQALETFGKTDLLSSPRIMVADGAKARIHVGSQVPYKTIDTREGPNGVIDRFEKVTIIDVGVEMEVIVQIHNDGMVTMQVTPQVSSVTGFSENIPVVETSETSSIVSVQDGHTVILGGLNKDEIRETRNGIPILGRIPILKYLFSSATRTKTRTELAILLTPRILTGRENIEDLDEWRARGSRGDDQ